MRHSLFQFSGGGFTTVQCVQNAPDVHMHFASCEVRQGKRGHHHFFTLVPYVKIYILTYIIFLRHPPNKFLQYTPAYKYILSLKF